MTKITSIALAVTLGAASLASIPAVAATFSGAAPVLGEDKCKGQTWPNLSDDCIKQIVAEVCKAGGGTNCTGGAATVTRVQFNAYKARHSR